MFTKKGFYLVFGLTMSLTLMSFDNNSTSIYGTSNEITSSSIQNNEVNEVAFTGALVRTAVNAGRWVAGHTARTCPQWERLAMDMGTIITSHNDEFAQTSTIEETKKAKLLSLN